MKKLLIWGGILVLVIVSTASGFYFFGGNSEDDIVKVPVKNIVEVVSVSGKIVPKKKADLAFEISGKITWVNTSVGANVYVGQILAKIDDGEINSKIDKTKLDFDARVIDKEKAELVLNNLSKKAPDVVNESYTKAYYAVRHETEEFFTDDETLSPKLTFSIIDSQTKTDLETKRLVVSETLNNWLSIVNSGDLSDANYRLLIIRDYIDLLLKAVNESINLSQTITIDYKNKLNTSRSSVNSAITAINNLEDEIFTQEKVIAQQQASILSVLSSIDEIKSQSKKNYLYAPFSGIVTFQEAEVGEISSPGKKIIEIISEKDLEIDSYIPEFYIGRVKVGQSAEVVLDAFPDKKITAKVKFIEPSETIIEGVPNFKTILSLESYDFEIKSGMTASVSIFPVK